MTVTLFPRLNGSTKIDRALFLATYPRHLPITKPTDRREQLLSLYKALGVTKKFITFFIISFLEPPYRIVEEIQGKKSEC